MPAENIAAHLLRNIGLIRPSNGFADAPSAAPSRQAAVDYEVIHAAVTANERGRWFLAEYARRNRAADTQAVLDAIRRLIDSDHSRGAPALSQRSLGTALSDAPTSIAASAETERLRAELAGMTDAIARIKFRGATGLPEDTGHDGEPNENPFASLDMANRCIGTIMRAAEQVQDVAWTMRRQSVANALCNRLDLCADELIAAGTQLDAGRRSVREVVHVLRYLDVRLRALTAARSEPVPPTTAMAPIVQSNFAVPAVHAEAAAIAIGTVPASRAADEKRGLPDGPATVVDAVPRTGVPNSMVDGASAMPGETAVAPASPATPAVELALGPNAPLDEAAIAVSFQLPVTPIVAEGPPAPTTGEAERPATAATLPLANAGRLVFTALAESGNRSIVRPDPAESTSPADPEPVDEPSAIKSGRAVEDKPNVATAAGPSCQPAPMPFVNEAQSIDPSAAGGVAPSTPLAEDKPSAATQAAVSSLPEGPAKTTTVRPTGWPEFALDAPPRPPATVANHLLATAQLGETRVTPVLRPAVAAAHPDPAVTALFADVMALSAEERIALFG